MEKNKELREAWEFVEHTGKSLFLTGKAGTGKTTFLKAVKEHSHKRMVVVAPTGVAAINAGGVTVHSFFQLPLSPYVPGASLDNKFTYSKEKRKIMRTMDMLVIDEISMVRSDVLDAIDNVMRRFREHDKPFGGVQLVMIGDLNQLTPVVRQDEVKLLSSFYTTPYFFGSHALQSIDYVTIELKHVYRQQDDEFLSILNDIRDGHATQEDISRLNARYNPNFRPNVNDGYIRLTTHNRIADDYNTKELFALKSKAFNFEAEVDKDFPEYDYPTEQRLTLKTGAQVMFLKNDSKGRYYNGKIGHVTYVDDHQILVQCPDDEIAIEVEKEVWENTKYKLNEETKQIESEVVGTFTQYPLRLAWAITIHKSQGLTFEHAIIDAQFSFASGQVYVALSRCKTLAGLVLASPISEKAIIKDNRVTDYISHQEEAAKASIERLPKLKEEYHRQLLTELFNLRPILLAETSLDRVMQEFFYGKTPLAALHHTALTELQTKVMPIADKWLAVINATSTEDLKAAAFQSRLKSSTLYFSGQLTDIFDDVVSRTKYLNTNNKMIRRRLEHAYDDMHDIYLAKVFTMTAISNNGFTPQNYLKFKQESILKAMENDEPATAKKTQRKSTGTKKAEPKVSTEKEKKPKVDTRKVTIDMYKEGKTIHEIAQERNLKDATIFNHLSYYVMRGEIPIDTLVSDKHQQAITRIIDKIGMEDSAKPIKALCPSDVTWEEIRLMMNFIKRSRR